MIERSMGRRFALKTGSAMWGAMLLPAAVVGRALRAQTGAEMIAIGSLVVGVMSLLTPRGDGGIGASLSAMNAKMDVLSKQVSDLQTALGKLAIAVGKLPAAFQEIVERQFILEQIVDINSAAEVYGEVSKRKGYRSSGPLAQNDRDDLRAARDRVRLCRSRLSANEVGEQPLAATIGMVALGIETSLELRLNGKDAGLREALEIYIDWMSRILDPNRNASAASKFASLTREVNLKILEIFKTSELKNARLDEVATRWSYESSLSDCYTEYKAAFSCCGRYLSAVDSVVGQIDTPAETGRSPTVHVAWRINAEVIPELHRRKWMFVWRTLPTRTGVAEPNWTPTTKLQACTPQRTDVTFSKTDAEAQQNALSRPKIRQAERTLSDLGDDVRQLDFLEERKAFAQISMDVAQATLLRAKSWRAELL